MPSFAPWLLPSSFFSVGSNMSFPFCDDDDDDGTPKLIPDLCSQLSDSLRTTAARRTLLDGAKDLRVAFKTILNSLPDVGAVRESFKG